MSGHGHYGQTKRFVIRKISPYKVAWAVFEWRDGMYRLAIRLRTQPAAMAYIERNAS